MNISSSIQIQNSTNLNLLLEPLYKN